MANAKKCDRCGKFYENNSAYREGGSILGGYVMGVGIFGSNYNTFKYYDLCDDCIGEFYRFLNNKK